MRAPRSTTLADDWKDAWKRDISAVKRALARLDTEATQMETECKHPPCRHSWGIRHAVTTVREALLPDDE